jgi:hypothetical protein
MILMVKMFSTENFFLYSSYRENVSACLRRCACGMIRMVKMVKNGDFILFRKQTFIKDTPS